MNPKNLVVVRRTARERIISAINESLQEVPAFVVLQILGEALQQVQLLDERQYADAIAEENKDEKKESDNNWQR